jgi:hypothetical protein
MSRPPPRNRAVRILARSLYRELRTGGYHAGEIVALSTELISLLTSDLRTGTSK